MLEWIPWALGAAILAWGALSFAHAVSGGQHAGQHETAPRVNPELTVENIQARRLRRFRFYQWANYVLSILVGIATIALIVAAIFF
jgi:hypothetical protein